jgi:hypothetical protein
MRLIKRAGKGIWTNAMGIKIIDDIAKVKIMQHHHARHLAQQIEHMLVAGRITKVVKHPVVMPRIFQQPINGTHATMRCDPGR